jgi:hypothetical protein
MEVIQEYKKNEIIKEIFKENWLKYGNYEKCVEELKKMGIDITIDYLRRLRHELNLPKRHDVLLKNKKCFYCNNPAEKIFGLRKFDNPIPVCRKCYRRESLRIFRKRNSNYKKLEHRKHYHYRYKYIIKPRIEDVEKIKHSLFGYELYDIKIRIGRKNKIFYSKINEDFSFPSSVKISKEDVVCIARFIKEKDNFYIVKEKNIDFDLIEEMMKNAGSI